MTRIFAIAVAAVMASCATPAAPPNELSGRWGGEHVGLSFDGASGRLDYDCAAGTIDGPLVPRADGSFVATGTHTPGHGGPDRVGEVDPSFPARYSGHVRGNVMRITVRVANGVLIGPYTLRRGAEPMLLRCL